ncbi:ABC transporter substrate-binding protein [Halobacteriales archaeon SW_7_68_16]|nr:MAG: ABC transporter substrate-binding protein [Halobacteriales archaeon SW_7_68_16]
MKGVGAAGAIGLAGCLGGGGEDRVPLSERTLRLGILMGVSGGLEDLGPAIRRSAELAVQQLDDADTEYEIESQFEDTATDANTGISAAERLVSSNYPMIAGALSSQVTVQVANNVTIPDGVVQMSPASTAPAITDLDDDGFVYRTTPTDALQAEVMAQITVDRLDASSASILGLNNDYGQGLAGAYESALGDRDVAVPANVSFEAEQSSYTSRLSEALGDDPDVMMIVGYPASGQTILRNFYADYSADEYDIIVPDGMKSGSLPDQVGQSLSNVTGTAPLSVGPGRDFFLNQYADAYDGEPDTPFTTEGYDTAAVLLLANAAAGRNDGAAIRDQVQAVANPEGTEITPENLAEGIEMAANEEEINYNGAASSVTFDDNGDVASATYEYFGFTDDGVETLDQIEFSAN